MLSGLKTLRSKFIRHQNGSVAVEFAMIALPFFLFIFALIETALIIFSSIGLDMALGEASRQIRTGQVQAAGLTREQFHQLVCDGAPGYFDCSDKLKVDVRRFDNFSNTDFVSPTDVNGSLILDFSFDPGGPSDIILARAFYVWNISSPIGVGLANMEGNNRLLASSAAFRNEPYNEDD